MGSAVALLVVFFVLSAGFYWWLNCESFPSCKPVADISEFQIDGEIIKKNEIIVKLTAQVIRKQISGLLTIGSFYANNSEVRGLVQQDKWQEAVNLALAASREDEDIDRIAQFDMDGILMANAPSQQSRNIGQGFAHRDWYKGVTSDFKPYVSEVFLRDTDPPFNVIGLSFPVLDNNGFPVAIMLFTVKTDTFLKWLSEIKFGASGKSFIVDQLGHVIAHPDIAPQGAMVDFSSRKDVQKALTGKSGSEITINLDNERIISSYEPITEYGWAVVTTIKLDEVIKSGLIKENGSAAKSVEDNTKALLEGF